jgi:hypothetical protein
MKKIPLEDVILCSQYGETSIPLTVRVSNTVHFVDKLNFDSKHVTS